MLTLYKLSVAIEVVNETPTVKVESQTVFGYLRALETLSQLCSYDRMTRTYFVASGVDIEDAPKFKYSAYRINNMTLLVIGKSVKQTVCHIIR